MSAVLTLLDDLATYRLEVVLAPSRRPDVARRGGCIRVAANQNPPWYRALCRRHRSSRQRRSAKPDTRIRRANILRFLERIAAGRPTRSRYAPELLAIAGAR
jgi:hypothetical protein